VDGPAKSVHHQLKTVGTTSHYFGWGSTILLVVREFATIHSIFTNNGQWEFQDPIDGGTLALYFWPYFVGIFPEK